MSARVYSLFLSLYPAELRRDFGAEMTEVFLEDLEDARRPGGVMGCARVWWRSVLEVFRLVLPELAVRREVMVPCIMWLLEICYFGSVIMTHPEIHVDLPKSPGELLGLILAGGVFPAAIALVALRVADSSVPVPLKLERP